MNIDPALQYVDEQLQRDILHQKDGDSFAYIGVGGKRLVVYLYDENKILIAVKRFEIKPLD